MIASASVVGETSLSKKPAAPALMDRRTIVASSNVVRMITGSDGHNVRHCSTSSGPSMPGITASASTTSTSLLCRLTRVSAADAQVVTTWISGDCASRSFRPRRRSCWSSTISTRIMGSHTFRQRQGYAQKKALGGGFGVKHSARLLGAFPQRPQAVALILRLRWN